jgi:hypothetical protein
MPGLWEGLTSHRGDEEHRSGLTAGARRETRADLVARITFIIVFDLVCVGGSSSNVVSD